MDGTVNARECELVDVPVDGGVLRVGVWDDATPGAPTVLLVHGVTSSHLAFAFLVDRLRGVRIVAPDLRGRGRSNELAGRAGMRAHAADLAATLDHLGVDRALVVGHSMGAFVSVVFAATHPERVTGLVLIDGGLPLDVPAGLDADTLVSLILGPTAARLSMRFTSPADYRDFWRQHPAFRRAWTPQLERYLDYDLVPAGDGMLRPATSYATTVDDTIDLNTGTALPEALAALRHDSRLITVPRGLQDEEPGLYSEDHLAGLLPQYPSVHHQRFDGFNHYTIVLSAAGADAVAMVIREELAASSIE